MKMRVRGNSIRLRLTQSEVAQFIETGAVSEKIEFGGSRNLTYQLKSSPDAVRVTAELDSACISIIIPEKDAGNWANSGQVGISAEQILDNGKILSLLVEKDFTCLEPRLGGEDDLDTFPHPHGGEKC